MLILIFKIPQVAYHLFIFVKTITIFYSLTSCNFSVRTLKFISFVNSVCTSMYLVFLNWQLISALAILERFGDEYLVLLNWRSCRHCLRNKWPLGYFFSLKIINLSNLKRAKLLLQPNKLKIPVSFVFSWIILEKVGLSFLTTCKKELRTQIKSFCQKDDSSGR